MTGWTFEIKEQGSTVRRRVMVSLDNESEARTLALRTVPGSVLSAVQLSAAVLKGFRLKAGQIKVFSPLPRTTGRKLILKRRGGV